MEMDYEKDYNIIKEALDIAIKNTNIFGTDESYVVVKSLLNIKKLVEESKENQLGSE